MFSSQTQSQELGAETVVDTDMLYDMGMVSCFKCLLHRPLHIMQVSQNISVGGKKPRISKKAHLSWTQAPRHLKRNHKIPQIFFLKIFTEDIFKILLVATIFPFPPISQVLGGARLKDSLMF